MPDPITTLAITAFVQLVQEALAAKRRGEALSAEQSHAIEVAKEESFRRLAEACGHRIED
jgi:hypothetical protein